MNLPLQPYDILMLVVIVVATVFGAWKGMAWQLAALASLVVSFIVATRCSGPLAPYFSVEEPWNRFLAMLVLYMITSLGIWLLFRLVAGVIDRVRLKEFDRQLGAMFGLAKGICWCVLITFFAVTLSESARQSILGTYSGYYTTVLIHKARPLLPDEAHRVLGHYIDEFNEKMDSNDPTSIPHDDAALTVANIRRAPGGAGGSRRLSPIAGIARPLCPPAEVLCWPQRCTAAAPRCSIRLHLRHPAADAATFTPSWWRRPDASGVVGSGSRAAKTLFFPGFKRFADRT